MTEQELRDRIKKAYDLLYPTRYKHWDMKACECPVCAATRVLEGVIHES